MRLDGLVDHALQQDRGAGVVAADVAFDLVHALADADLGREVEDEVDAAERPVHRVAVPHVALQEFDAFRQGCFLAGVGLLDQAIDDPARRTLATGARLQDNDR